MIAPAFALRHLCIRKTRLMKTIAWFFILACVCPSVLGQHADEGGTVASLRALEYEWVAGQSRNDVRVLDLMFDNALVYVEYGNLVSKGQYLARIKRQNPQLNQITFEGTTVRIFGNTALVIGTYREKKVSAKKAEAQRWRFIDTWFYKNGSWVLIAAGATPITG